jgi:23S rRNA pseudouridine1911/1915/1917 synthase
LIQSIISADPDTPAADDPWQDALVEDAASQPELRAWRVGSDGHGQRLDKALSDGITGFSRSWLQQLVEQGEVSVNGRVCAKASSRLKAGDRLQVALRPPLQMSAFLPEALPLQVIFEDAHLLVIDKPAGLVVHPAAGNWSGTLLNGLLAYHEAAAQLPRAGIVHRLDKDTSGLMVVGKTLTACDALVRQIAAREVHRLYLALVHGRLAGAAERTIQGYIARDPRNRLRMAAVREGSSGARDALTWVRCLDSGPTVSWVGCKLHTGRTHQIRVHLASIGHALVGDTLYGGHPLLGMNRQALHAHRLVLRHPVDRSVLRVESPLPPDLWQALAAAGLDDNRGQLWAIDDNLSVLSA